MTPTSLIDGIIYSINVRMNAGAKRQALRNSSTTLLLYRIMSYLEWSGRSVLEVYR
jgi:hypothetical protein